MSKNNQVALAPSSDEKADKAALATAGAFSTIPKKMEVLF